MEIEPINNYTWLTISSINEENNLHQTILTGNVEHFANIWGFRFIPESIYISLCGLFCPTEDLSYLPAINDIASNLETHSGESVRILIKYVEAYEIVSTIGLSYNAFGFNYYIFQIIMLSLISLCFLAIIIFEAKGKRKKRKLQRLLLTLNK